MAFSSWKIKYRKLRKNQWRSKSIQTTPIDVAGNRKLYKKKPPQMRWLYFWVTVTRGSWCNASLGKITLEPFYVKRLNLTSRMQITRLHRVLELRKALQRTLVHLQVRLEHRALVNARQHLIGRQT